MTLGRGEGIEFADEKLAGDPVIVQPEDPGGHVVLLTADALVHDDPNELLKHARRGGHRLVLSIQDVDELYLDDVKPLAEGAASEDRTLVIRVGGH